MAKNKRPRKRYKPRHPDGLQLPVTIRFSPKAEMDLQMIPHQELEAVMRGEGTEYSLGAINFRINSGYVLAGETFADPQLRSSMETALGGVHAMIARWKKTGKVGCTGEEFRAIGAGLTLCDEMQLVSTRRELLHATNVVDRVTEWKLRREHA
jgi:hypothetical protein